MIAWIPARRNPDVKSSARKFFSEFVKFCPRPVPQFVFALKCSPRRDEWNDFHLWPKSRLQVLCKWFGDERDGVFLARGAQEWRGDDEIAESPKFDDEQ